MNPVLYGLPNCDTCKKARNWLVRFEVTHDFVDYRAREPRCRLSHAEGLGSEAGWLGEAAQQPSSTLPGGNLLPQRKNPGSDPEWTLLLKGNIPRYDPSPGGGYSPMESVSVGFTDNGFKKLFGR